MALTQEQLLEKIQAQSAKVQKIGVETALSLQKIQELKDALENAGTTTPEVDAALQALDQQLQIVDDQVADVPTEPEETTTTTTQAPEA